MKFRALLILVLAAMAFSVAGGMIAGCGATDNGSDSDSDADSDGDTDTDSDSDSDGDTTIYDVQQGEFAEDAVVSLTGVIVSAPPITDDEYGSGYIWVQEPEGGEYSGIVLYLWSDVMVEMDVAMGDVLDVTGAYTEYYDLSEITVSSAGDISVTGTATLPTPDVVSPGDVATGGTLSEAYESVPVTVENVDITDTSLSYGQWEITGGLVVDDFFFTTDSGPSTDNIIAMDGESFDSITGILNFGYEEFTLAPRSGSDYEGYTGGDVDWDIYDIQQGVATQNATFTLYDVIVTSPLTYNGKGFFIQEQAGGEYSGIYVYNYNGDTDPASVSVGDIIDITGTYQEFESVSEFVISTGSAVSVTGTGTVPAAAVVDTADVGDSGALAENYEGVLVQVQNVTVVTAADSYGVIEIDDSLYIDDDFFTSGTGPDPAVSDTYTSITGPLHYSFDHFKILPRTSADLVD